MKKRFCLYLFLLLPLILPADVALMAKRHSTHRNFERRPYANKDMSYGAFFDIMEGSAGWRLGAMYGSGLTGAFEADTVITPEITLLLQDGIWETGVSVLRDYVDSEAGSGWERFYYQIQLGVNIPFGPRGSIGAAAFYPMEKLNKISDFSFRDLDYGLVARIRF